MDDNERLGIVFITNMNLLKVSFENCYGIKKLNHSFDFSNGCAHVIYAPNGAMKSSFAKIFDDVSKKQISKDRVFSERSTTNDIKDGDGLDLSPDHIFVIERYRENYRSEKLSTLLVNQALKENYENILFSIDEKKNALIKDLQATSGLKNNLIEEFTKIFKKTSNDFFLCLEDVEPDVIEDSEPIYSNIKYINIFNDKVLDFLNSKNFKNKLSEYIEIYDQLISKSTYFKKGIFNHNNADTVSKTLKVNGFFDAKHSVSLNSGVERKEFLSQDDLDFEINNEKSKILTDDDLSKKFKELDDAITKNVLVKDFRSLIEDNLFIIPELNDLEKLKKNIWISYLKNDRELYKDLINKYRNGKVEIESIIEKAKEEETSWKQVVDIFNRRFAVPYTILVKNQDDVILKGAVPTLVFEYFDNLDKKEIGGAQLLDVLSTGEQRALYLLNIIFEIEIRKNNQEKTVLIIDDIADSFDYKNKYAIIEYLKDILDSEKFVIIILTHNFDFYRTILSRLDINIWTNNLITVKNETEIKLVCGKNNLDVFGRLKKRYHEDNRILVACIPFVRNLIEYTIGPDCDHYKTLTALLHIKPQKRLEGGTIIKNSIDITLKDLESIFDEVFHTTKPLDNNLKSVLELINELAEGILIDRENDDCIAIENKLVLSIAIRLQAEAYMISRISDIRITDNITKYQTSVLLKKFKSKFSDEKENIHILEQVNLMTPENIHLNSFMYEPLLDISDHHLKKLYQNIKNLIITE